MKFRVTGGLIYDVHTPSTLILNIHALRTQQQSVIEEVFTIDPYVKVEEIASVVGENRLLRMDIKDPAIISLFYAATVDNSYTLIDFEELQDASVADLDPAVLPFLYPSRYCQSDKLYRLANNKFGDITNPFLKVVAITDWIHRNVEYLSGSTNAQTSAYDTVTEQAGVCRDFAHLGIALCRALNIPARYFTGYVYQLIPPDFHACFEAYLGGEWIIFDATKLAPLNGLVKIATGRDAADASIANLFGDLSCTYINVSCELADIGFEPFFYKDGTFSGISYK